MAQEVLSVGDEYGKDTELTVVVEKDVEGNFKNQFFIITLLCINLKTVRNILEDSPIESHTTSSTTNNLADLEKLNKELPNENTPETMSITNEENAINSVNGITSDSEFAQTSNPLVRLKVQQGLLPEAVDVEKSGTNTDIKIEGQYQSLVSEVSQSKVSLSEGILPKDASSSESKLRGTTDVEISRLNDAETETEFVGAISEDISQSNNSENEAELEDKIGEELSASKITAAEMEADIEGDLKYSKSVAEVIENEIITTAVAAEKLEDLVTSTKESIPAYTALVDEAISTAIPSASNEQEEAEVNTTQSESDVTMKRMENNTQHETEGITELEDENVETTTTTTVAATESFCTEPGTYAKENDCRIYINCTPTTTNLLIRAIMPCPTGQAYNPALLRCTRDLSPCADAFSCEMEGTFADPHDNASYYWCVASRLTIAYHIYHIKCGNGQIFTHELGKCFVDMTNLQDLPLNYELYMSKSPDEECVREEVKVLKAEEKAKLKEAKLREKIRKKYEKELQKKAAKEAKEQAKLQGISLEDETPFSCVEEGDFAAAAESFFDYFICQKKKDKFRAIGMKCANGQRFSTAQNICTP